MGPVTQAVAAAFLIVLPVCVGLLGFTARGRDPLVARVLLAVAGAFVLVAGLGRAGATLASPMSPLPPGLLWLWPAAALGLGIRLLRDRQQAHMRSPVESWLVLGTGAMLLATLLSLPAFLAGPQP